MQKIRMIGFFFDSGLHWQFAVRLLLFQYVPASKPFDHAWFVRLYKPQHCTVLDPIIGSFKTSSFCRILDKFTRKTEPIRKSGVLLQWQKVWSQPSYDTHICPVNRVYINCVQQHKHTLFFPIFNDNLNFTVFNNIRTNNVLQQGVPAVLTVTPTVFTYAD